MSVRRVLKWIGISIGGFLGLALIAVVIVYFVIGNDLEQTFDVGLTDLVIPTDEASILEGERLARLRGCAGGCHGKETEGDVFFDVPDGTKLIAPDLAVAARKYTTAELARIIRHGVRPDGTSVLIPMPSEMFTHLSDQDLVAIVAFLQAQSPGTESFSDSYFGPVARVMLFFYKQETDSILAAELIDHDQERPAPSPDDTETFGKYLAMTVCTECHGSDLKGFPEFDTPPLSVVLAYSIEDFTTLMRTGVPIGGRELDLMVEVAVKRFSRFTDDEIEALHAYLTTLSGESP